MKTQDIDLIQRVTGRPWITARSMLLGEVGIGQLLDAAREEGRRDAAMEGRKAPPRFGCHVDLFDGDEPDGCVIDEGRKHDCLYAERHRRKERCPYWYQVGTTGPR